MPTPDTFVQELLNSFAVDIIKRVSKKLKIDPDDLAAEIPGLAHSHWYISDGHVDGCLYCQRTKRLEDSRG